MIIEQALGYLEKDPETNIPKLMALVDKVVPNDWYASQRNAFRNVIADKDNNWYRLIKSLWTDLDAGCGNLFENFIVNVNLIGFARQERRRRNTAATFPGPS